MKSKKTEKGGRINLTLSTPSSKMSCFLISVEHAKWKIYLLTDQNKNITIF